MSNVYGPIEIISHNVGVVESGFWITEQKQIYPGCFTHVDLYEMQNLGYTYFENLL